MANPPTTKPLNQTSNPNDARMLEGLWALGLRAPKRLYIHAEALLCFVFCYLSIVDVSKQAQFTMTGTHPRVCVLSYSFLHMTCPINCDNEALGESWCNSTHPEIVGRELFR